ncbi:MAG: hypothetical protein P4L40_14575 [Terracidiphilus sp.]|nr:hypothetical protein [Terracidiphilus sp.]
MHINEWQAKIEATHVRVCRCLCDDIVLQLLPCFMLQEAYKIFSTARVKLDHYKEKVDGALHIAFIRSTGVCFLTFVSLAGIQQKMARGSLDAKMQDQLQRVCDSFPIGCLM